MYFILSLILSIWKCILKLPNVIIISIIKPFKYIFILIWLILYIPEENSIKPIKIELYGSFNLIIFVINDNIIEKNNMFENIIESVYIALLREFEYILKKVLFILSFLFTSFIFLFFNKKYNNIFDK